MTNTIGKKIQQLRVNKGISQNDLANYFHVLFGYPLTL